MRKKDILKETDGGLDYFKEIFPELNNTACRNNRYNNIINTYRGEKKASLTIRKIGEVWYAYDHGDPDYSGNAFDFAGVISDKELSFKEKLKEVNSVTGKEWIESNSNSKYLLEKGKLKEGEDFKIEEKSLEQLNEIEEKFFLTTGISKEVFKDSGAVILKSYTFRKSDDPNKIYTVSVGEEGVIIGYKHNKSVKIYKPYDLEFKFQWLGDKNDYVFGIEELIALNKSSNLNRSEKLKVYLCAGEKDALVLKSRKLTAICLNSETTTYFPESMNIHMMDIADKCDLELVIVYDDDKTGRKQAKAIKEKHNEKYNYSIRIHEWSNELKDSGGKDVTDWIEKGLGNEELVKSLKGLSSVSDISSSKLSEAIVDKELDKDSYSVNMETNKESFGDRLDFQAIEEKLPATFKQCIDPFNLECKVMMLFSFLTSFGAALKNITIKYRGNKIYPNLYTFIIAPAASGKSMVKWAGEVVSDIDSYLQKRSKNAIDQYNEEKQLVAKGEMKFSELGDKPQYETFNIPANITSAMLMFQLRNNDGYGLLTETEIDGLIESLEGAGRGFSDIMRKGFENESLSSMRKTDEERIFIDKSVISVLMTGTIGQFQKLIPDAENGLFSRVITYNLDPKQEWISAMDTDEFSYEEYFEDFKILLLEFYQTLESYPEALSFELTTQQYVKFDNYFSDKFDSIRSIAGQDGRASVIRTATIVMKIATILSAVRRLENDSLMNQNACEDDDFEVALSLADIVLDNMLQTLRNLKNQNIEDCYRGKKLDYFYCLPNEFTYSESQKIAEDIGVKVKTAEKWIYQFRDKGFLLNPSKGHFKKSI